MQRTAALLLLHGTTLLLCLLVFAAIMLHSVSLTLRNVSDATATEITMFHDEPSAIAIRRTVGGAEGFVEFENRGRGSVMLRVPGNFKQSDARIGTLNIPATLSASGAMTDWTLPQRSSMLFTVFPSIDSLHILHAAGVPLSIASTTVDLATGTSSVNSLITTEELIVLD